MIKHWLTFTVNRGKNESDRILPFNMWLELPLSITPYFEVMFVVQVSIYSIDLHIFVHVELNRNHRNIEISLQKQMKWLYFVSGRIRVSRLCVLSLLRQPFVHFKFAHCQPVSYLAIQICQYVQRTREKGKALWNLRWKIGTHFLRIRKAQSLHSTASSSYRILQKIGRSVQFNSIWTGVTFQLVDVPRWIPDTHGSYYNFYIIYFSLFFNPSRCTFLHNSDIQFQIFQYFKFPIFQYLIYS